MGKIKAVLFDFGGVLAEEGFRNGLLELGRRQGLNPQTVPGRNLARDRRAVVFHPPQRSLRRRAVQGPPAVFPRTS